jgi:integrase
LRHTWATLALKAGEHTKAVADRRSHTTTNVALNIYGDVVEGMQSQAAENMAVPIFGRKA